MGVKDLWGILSPVQRHVRLEDLQGQTVAVDLSIWVVEVQGMKQLQAVHKPHLRNLFFRVHKLLQLGILPVFVLEGDAPPLKYEAMMKRIYGAAYKSGTAPMKLGRSHFKSKLKECAEMLHYMGVPCVQSAGEAEAFCALLNKHGLVDACITEDGDAFLYGARTVYRNFTINIKDPSVEIYKMNDIETTLGLNQEALVGLGVLLGCDYLPKGVPGVGKELSMRLVNSLPGVNILDRMKQWRLMSEQDIANTRLHVRDVAHCKNCHHPGTEQQHGVLGCPLCGSTVGCRTNSADISCPCHWHSAQKAESDKSAEMSVRKKALADPAFPHKQVINEFLKTRDKVPPGRWQWSLPLIFQMQNFAMSKLEWEEKYTQEKMLPLVTLWTMRQMEKNGNVPLKGLHPHRIVKTRILKKVPVYEVEWEKYAEDDTTAANYYTTLEEQDLFNKCFPWLQLEYLQTCEEKEALKSKGRAKKNKTKPSKSCEDKENLLTEKLAAVCFTDEEDFLPVSQIKTANKSCKQETPLAFGKDCSNVKENTKTLLSSTLNHTVKDLVKDIYLEQAQEELSVLGRQGSPRNMEVYNTATNAVVDLSSDEDEWLPVSQLISKVSKCHINDPQTSNTKNPKVENDSDEDDIELLPLSQRLMLRSSKSLFKVKKSDLQSKDKKSSEPECKLQWQQETKQMVNIKEESEMKVNNSSQVDDLSNKKTSKTSKTSKTAALEETSNSCKCTSKKESISADKKLKHCHDILCKPLSTQKRHTASLACTKTTINYKVEIAKEPTAINKKPAKQQGRKTKLSKLNALHDDLEMLCMDSVLGDVTTGAMNFTSFLGGLKKDINQLKSRPQTVKDTLANTYVEIDMRTLDTEPNPSIAGNISTDESQVTVIESNVLSLTFDDLRDEIISGAAEIYDDDGASFNQSTSNKTVVYQHSQRQNHVVHKQSNIGYEDSQNIEQQNAQNISVWGQRQVGQFDLGLTFDTTVASVVSANSITADLPTIYTDSCVNYPEQSELGTLYADSCLKYVESTDISATIQNTFPNHDTILQHTKKNISGKFIATHDCPEPSLVEACETTVKYVDSVTLDTFPKQDMSIVGTQEVTCFEVAHNANMSKNDLHTQTLSVITAEMGTSGCDMVKHNYNVDPTTVNPGQNRTLVIPDQSTAIPHKNTFTPDQYTVSHQCTVLPNQNKINPDQGTRTPDQYTVIPDKSTVIPDNGTTDTEQDTVNPCHHPVIYDETVIPNTDNINPNISILGCHQETVTAGDSVSPEPSHSTTEPYSVIVNDTVEAWCIADTHLTYQTSVISQTVQADGSDLDYSDCEVIAPSPVSLSQRLQSKLHGSQLRAFSVCSQTSTLVRSHSLDTV